MLETYYLLKGRFGENLADLYLDEWFNFWLSCGDTRCRIYSPYNRLVYGSF